MVMSQSALWQRIEGRLDSSYPGWRKRVDSFGQMAAVKSRASGRAWSDDEVFKALLMAVLSTNTDWSKVERVQGELADLFCGFSLESYAERQPDEIGERVVPWFLERRAGSVSLERNLVDFIGAARKLAEHRRAHGSAESYFTSLVRRSGGDPKQGALLLGHQGEYKLPAFGVALAAEALKNLGFDVAKPDRHLGRAMGSFGLARFQRWPGRSGRASPPLTSRTSLMAVMTAAERIATEADRPVVLVDNAIWMLCARSGLYLTNPELAEMAGDRRMEGGQAATIGALIDSWAGQEDHGEQRETVDLLVEGLDTERLSERKLFPGELKGKSW